MYNYVMQMNARKRHLNQFGYKKKKKRKPSV